jgi:hypothetical protein
MGELRISEVLTRVFVVSQRFRQTVQYYKALTSGRCSLYLTFPERGLELAAVSSPVASFLVIAGSEEAVAPFRATMLTVTVEDIRSVAEHLVPLGAAELQSITPVPTGYQTRLRHPDGLVVEYVQHTEAADRFRDSDL